jgi:uncharacterized membrane protein YtjA (UPF0391 family)
MSLPLASRLQPTIHGYAGDGRSGRALGSSSIPKGVGTMLYYALYALVFLVVGLIAGVLGLSGIAAVAGQIAWILFVIGLVLLVVHLVRGRAPRTL